MTVKPYNIIVATDKNLGIGLEGKMPWVLPEDLKYFKKITSATVDPNKKNAVIMGRITWDSIPEKFRPLPGRQNIVISRQSNLELPQNVQLAASFKDSLALAANNEAIENTFIIGGAAIYKEAIAYGHIDKLYLTQLLTTFDCDTFFPEIKKSFTKVSETEIQDSLKFSFVFEEYKAII